jgi:hypothetical protein
MALGEAFGPIERQRLHEAVSAAERQTGMHFAVYVGRVDGDIEEFARAEVSKLAYLGPEVVVLAVDPDRRGLQIVTSRAARQRLEDNACGLAALSMTTSFGLGDLVGGLVVGLRMLADATLPARQRHGRPVSTSSTVTHGV